MAKGKKSRVPKRIAGVKLPKALRRSKALNSLLGNDVGRQLLADALVAAATAAAGVLAARHKPELRQAGQAVGEQLADARDTVVDTAQQAGSATRDLAHAAAGALAHVVTDAALSLVSTKAKPASGAKAASSRRH
ncbi:MAG TPA: hypothetical protein VED40_03105 [Azospirillaceae bacterium]|nr:hypothetical protein [Azospirillaceae bacterium]